MIWINELRSVSRAPRRGQPRRRCGPRSCRKSRPQLPTAPAQAPENRVGDSGLDVYVYADRVLASLHFRAAHSGPRPDHHSRYSSRSYFGPSRFHMCSLASVFPTVSLQRQLALSSLSHSCGHAR